jgi:DNA invertase Pin-like site-specific DNA recombinase
LKGDEMARKKIDEEIRQKVIEAHASRRPMRRIAKEFGVGLSSVHRIVKEKGPEKVQKKMSKAERLKKIADIERRIADLEKKILGLEAKKG